MKLIVNADDFGLSIGVSKGILDGMKKGIVTDTSAIVNTHYFIESAQMALRQGVRAMGIHLLLTMGEPILSKDKVKSLLTEDGHFCTRKEITTMAFNITEVKEELEAQIAKFLSTGLLLNHIDTHHGFMNHSKEMANVFVELANKYNVPLRNEASRLGSEKHCFPSNIDVFKTQYVYFNHGTPYHELKHVQAFLDSAHTQYECIEIGCHPGYSDAILRDISLLNDERELELELFMSEEIQTYCKDKHIELVSYSTI